MPRRSCILDLLILLVLLTTGSFTHAFCHPPSTLLHVERGENIWKDAGKILPQVIDAIALPRRHLFAENNVQNDFLRMGESTGRLCETSGPRDHPHVNPDFGSSTHTSYYDPTNDIQEYTATVKQALVEKASTYSDSVKEGFSSGVAGATSSLDELRTTLKATGQQLVIKPETLLQAKDGISSYINEHLSYESFHDFSRHYVTSLEEAYGLSDLVSGKSIEELIAAITMATNGIVEAMDLKENASLMLLVAGFFWGSDQRRVGLERGRQIGEEQVKRMEDELRAAAARSASKQQMRVESSEVEDLRQKMVRGIV